MRLTIHILVLPVMMILGGFFFGRRSDMYSQVLCEAFFYLWIATALVCFVRGFIIWRQHRYLALGCFAVALAPIGLAFIF